MVVIAVKENINMKVIDVSYWQVGIDWDAVVANGVEGVIIKLTEGEAIEESFYEHVNNAKEHGLKWGVYAFSHASTPEEARMEGNEVVYLLNKFGEKPPLGVWFDFESKENLNCSDPTAVCSAFISFCNANGYDTVGVYASLSTLVDVVSVYSLANYVPYWVAQYSDTCDFNEYYPNARLAGWQYSDKEYIGNTNVDMNEWYL